MFQTKIPCVPLLLCAISIMDVGTLRIKLNSPKLQQRSIDQSIERETTAKSPRAKILYKGGHFQDIFMEEIAPHAIQFGHVCENPKEWEQRFEERDFEKNRHLGKVKWGDANGAYGESYWDLNH